MDEAASFKSWTTRVVSKSVTKQQLDFAERNKCVVRHRITFEPRANAVLEKREYSLNDFLVEMGSASALLGIGYALLTSFQNTVVPLVQKFLDKRAAKAKATGGAARNSTAATAAVVVAQDAPLATASAPPRTEQGEPPGVGGLPIASADPDVVQKFVSDARRDPEPHSVSL